uniref:Uncharacterized protein n=1 Tax=Panagrolaimus sp. PS1159 TaxID=55785 RepID=A0AC35FDZ1_9BILA
MEALGLPVAQIDAALTVPYVAVAESVADEEIAELTENRVEGKVAPAAVEEANTADPSVGSKKSSGLQSEKEADPNKESGSSGTEDAGKEKKKEATLPPPVSPEDDDDGW